MDTVYGTKKYFQSLGAADNDYYNRHSSSATRVMQAACSSYQNTLGRHSTIGPYSHLTHSNPYTAAAANNDFSHTSQYGYNSWGMWRDSRNLTPSSSYSSKSRSSIKSFTIILMTAAFIVIVAVLSVAALSFYFSTFKSDDSIMIFDGKFQVTRGDVFTNGLKYNHTSVYQQKVDYYRNLITESLNNNGLSVYKCEINGFGNGPLIQVDFRVFLDMRKVPITIRSVEDHIKDSLLKETMSLKSTKGLQIDLASLEIKRLLDADVLRSASFIREQATTPSSMMFDDKPRTANKASTATIINKPSSRQTTSKPKQKSDIVEAEIDIENVPVLQGSFEVTKTDADITQKRVRTSTLKPFTITNGSVRMKPKKTTIEKVRPLPKVPENLTANILKLENVTKPFHYDRVTTPTPTTTTDEIPITSTEAEIKSSSTVSTTVAKLMSSTTPASKEIAANSNKTTVKSTAASNMPSIVLPSEPPPRFKPLADLNQLEAEIGEHRPAAKPFPSSIVLDDQPWQPIQPSTNQMNYTLNDAKKKIHNIVNPPVMNTNYNNDDMIGFKLLPRNKLQGAISTQQQKTNRPPIYQSYNNPALMYGTHEVEQLGGSFVKPYPIPIDLIGDQTNQKIVDDLILNKGEVLATDKQTTKTPIIEITPINMKKEESSSTTEYIKLNTDEVIDKTNNKTELTIGDVTEQQVGEILFDLLKDSNVKLNASKVDEEELLMESRDTDFDLPEQKSSNAKISADETVESSQEVDHTEAIDALATVISSMETLSFKNIKDYIMATTKAFGQELTSTSTERMQTTPRKELTQIDPMVKSDRIALIAPVPAANTNENNSELNKLQSSPKITTTTTSPSIITAEPDNEPATASYVEVETVQYTPGTSSSSWSPSLFPVESKWQYVNGSLVYPSKAPMKKVFNETLQAWIIENPVETTTRLSAIELQRNSSEPIKNISAIFDTLASKLGINPKVSTKLPPFMAHINKNKNEQQTTPAANLQPLSSTTAFKRLAQTTPTPAAASSVSSADDELPVLLNQQTESYYGTSAETSFGQAEVEEVDPTQYEQMLLIDRVSNALRPTSTAPSLITLMPVKSNSGLRRGAVIHEKMKGSGRGFPPSAASSSSSNKHRFEDTSFVIRTNINVSS